MTSVGLLRYLGRPYTLLPSRYASLRHSIGESGFGWTPGLPSDSNLPSASCYGKTVIRWNYVTEIIGYLRPSEPVHGSLGLESTGLRETACVWLSYLGLAMWLPNGQPPVNAVNPIMPHERLTLQGLDHPILTREEELELCRKLPNRAARDKLITSNLRLIVRAANSIKRRGDLTLNDCVQWGIVGFIHALEKFDPERGTRLSTYSIWWVKQSIRRAIHDEGSTVRVPVHRREAQAKIGKARARVRAATGREATVRELAEMLPRLPVEKILKETETPGSFAVSLDAPMTGEEGARDTFHDVTPNDGPSPEDEAIAHEGERQAWRALGSLKDHRERAVIDGRFGLSSGEGVILQEIGARFQLSRERVRQIEVSALKKLRMVSAR